MHKRLENRIALATGAARGIGAAIARAFAAEGATVFVTDLDHSDGPGLADELGERAVWLALDVREETHWERAMAEIMRRAGRLDIVVNNAGITGLENPDAGPHDPEHCTLEAWRAVHRTNLDGVFLGCRHAIRAMHTPLSPVI
ncbi:MAG: SDR family oxidoreductase [Xanthomonadaceae bacterium]|nr:SDR family oxidoreductase [Xanthomonadaceae bacterium]